MQGSVRLRHTESPERLRSGPDCQMFAAKRARLIRERSTRSNSVISSYELPSRSSALDTRARRSSRLTQADVMRRPPAFLVRLAPTHAACQFWPVFSYELYMQLMWKNELPKHTSRKLNG